MDEMYLRHAVRYVELNPVEAGLVSDPSEYRWSSAAAHLKGQDDALVRVRPMLDRISDWKAYLKEKSDLVNDEVIERHGKHGLPLGEEAFVSALEVRIGRPLRPGKKGRPRLEKAEELELLP
jgi:putative transposase